jgi:hypothetical protein
MGIQRVSATWLTDDMAHALAAMCPPLQVADVVQAADELSEDPASPQVVMVDWMFRLDVDPVKLRNVNEALHALHDLAHG